MDSNNKNRRNTKQRKIILGTVKNRCDHPSADEIYLDVHSVDEKISKGTVYRNLKLLCDEEEIQQIKIPGSDRFDKTTKKHSHILCTKCKKVIDTTIEYRDDFDSFVEKESGFIIKKHQTVFEGVCPECQKNCEVKNRK